MDQVCSPRVATGEPGAGGGGGRCRASAVTRTAGRCGAGGLRGRRTAIAQWIRARGRFGDVTIGDVQLGYEITWSAGGKNFVTNAFSVTG